MSSDQQWFEQAFQQEYLDLYLHRDLAEAGGAVEFLKKALALDPQHRLLDLCCGPGRHLTFLKECVGSAIGIDLSRPLLRRAQIHGRLMHGPARSSAAPHLARADMRRLPLAAACMDRVVNLFTSFGYFLDDEENLQVLREVSRILRPGGLFALDHINRSSLIADFDSRTERRLPSGMEVVEERRWDEAARRIEKHVILRDANGDKKQWVESVRVYDPEELAAMLWRADLEPVQRHGNYDGSAWSPESGRLILIARAAR